MVLSRMTKKVEMAGFWVLDDKAVVKSGCLLRPRPHPIHKQPRLGVSLEMCLDSETRLMIEIGTALFNQLEEQAINFRPQTHATTDILPNSGLAGHR